jgi:peptidoglycan/xylan/chitin deacetylase (PgdA/CDA1 family)
MDDRDPVAAPPPAARPRGSRLAGPALAAALAVVLVALIGGILLIPGLLPGSAIGSPGSSSGPTGTASASSAIPSPTPLPTFVRPTPTPEPTFFAYVVRAGDSLNSIADRFRTSARSIAWWNRGSYPNLDPQSAAYEPDHIEPGWVLVLIPGVTVDDANPPTPSPGVATPVPTLGPSPTSASSPVAGAPATVVNHGPRTSTQIALTFDMGGRLDPAVDIVQWLVDHGIHATIFSTGSAATTTTEGRGALELAATRPDLFAFGNHSWDHPDFTTLTAAQMADELTSTETAIDTLIGVSTKPWFRPPYGAWTDDVRVGVGAAGWSEMVMWDIDTIDWKATADGGPTADDIVTRVISKAQGGSIVLMHLGGWHTLEALPALLGDLESRGLTPVTLPTLLGS